MKKDAIPVAHPPRRVPHAILERLKQKLDNLVTNKIVEKVVDYSEWVNYLVTIEKKDLEKTLRLCMDPQELNQSISEELELSNVTHSNMALTTKLRTKEKSQ